MEFVIRDCKMISQYQYLAPNKRYYSKRGKEFIQKFQTIIKSQMVTKKYETLDSDNIECEVVCYFDNKRKNDCDNFIKPILDNLEKCNVFLDDRYITKLIIEKKYSKPLDICAIIKIKNRNNVVNITE
jgi:Holliday junction resolvase RusA-like endonuclease